MISQTISHYKITADMDSTPSVTAWYRSRLGRTAQMTRRILFCLLCWQLASFGQDDASFDVVGAGTPDKQSVLKGVERDFFSPLPQEQWNALPTMLEVTFQFEPRRGNTDRLGDTFLLKVNDVGVSVANEDYPAIGVKTSFGFHQKFPYNAMPDDKGKYCTTTPCQSTMYFLIPRPVKRFVLTYRKAAVAQGRVQRRR